MTILDLDKTKFTVKLALIFREKKATVFVKFSRPVQIFVKYPIIAKTMKIIYQLI